MKNGELDRLLKSAPLPPVPPAYWKEFPRRVTAKIHWQAQRTGVPVPDSTLKAGWPAWALGLGAACVLALAFTAGFWRGRQSTAEDPQLALARKYYREVETLFPHQVRAIVFGSQGPQLVLANRANVPSSPPFYLKICGRQGCEEMITFSGQQIQIDGEPCEVLANGRDQILVVGKKQVWSAENAAGPNRLEARPLGATL